MVENVGDWRWSSYRATLGVVNAQSWLNTDWLLAAFGDKRKEARMHYERFVAQGRHQPSPWRNLKNQIYLGGDEFIAELQGMIDASKELSEIPSSQRRAMPLKLREYKSRGETRDEGIVAAYASGGYTQKEIGDYFGLHYTRTRVSRIISRAKGKT